MTFQVLPWLGGDGAYDSVVGVEAASDGEAVLSASQLRSSDESRHALGFTAERRVAEIDGHAVGHIAFGHLPTAVVADVYTVRLRVVPSAWHRGVGRALHEEALASGREHGIRRYFAYVDGRRERGIRFAEAAGYREKGRSVEAVIDPRRFDPEPFSRILSGMRTGGLEIRSVAQLQSDRSDWVDRLYALHSEVASDTPFPIDEVETPIGIFRASVMGGGSAVPGASFVAVDGDDWVGLTEVRNVGGNARHWSQELTGVLASHRNRGVATALKVRSLTAGRTAGIRRIHTWNDRQNAPMIRVNARLGFTQTHDVVQYLRDDRAGPEAGPSSDIQR